MNELYITILIAVLASLTLTLPRAFYLRGLSKAKKEADEMKEELECMIDTLMELIAKLLSEKRAAAEATVKPAAKTKTVKAKAAKPKVTKK